MFRENTQRTLLSSEKKHAPTKDSDHYMTFSGYCLHDAGHRRQPTIHGDDDGHRDARPRGEEDGVLVPVHLREAKA